MICKLLKYTMMLLLALMVSGVLDSCISDDFVGACPSESEEKTVYLSINVKSDFDISLTRAGGDSNANGTVAGSHSDHLTTDHIAIFFNENETKDGPGKLYAITTLGLPATHEDYNGDAEKEANYMATIRVTKEDKDKIENGEIVLPKYCLVVLNSGPMKDTLEAYANRNDVDIETFLKKIWSSTTDPKEIGFTADGRFTMSNSVYVKNGKVHAAQEISPLNFRNTPDEARRAPVTIYVERLVAKFTFAVINNSAMTRADDGGIIITPKDGTDPLVFFDQLENGESLYKAWPWQVKVTGWGINAQEQKSYLFKNINPASAYFKDWNDEGNYRSYWCEDSHYDYEYDENGNKTLKKWTYPWQYRKAVDKDLESYGINKTNLLKNYSYNAFADPGKIGEEVYAPENTYDPSLYSDKSDLTTYLDDRTSLLAGTHLLVCAEMQVDDGKGFSTPEHIYRDRQGIYYESKAQFFKMFVSTINELLKSQRTMDFVLYDWDNGGQKEVKYGKGDNDKTSKLTAKVWNNNVVYKLYYHPDDDTYKELTDEVIEDLIANETFDMVSATIEYGDGRVLPWFKDNMLVITDDTHTDSLQIWTRDSIADLNGTFDDKGNPQSGFKIIEGINVMDSIKGYYDNCIKSLLCEWFGPIDHFNGGKMYYAAPISHNKSDADGTDETDDTDDAEQEEKLGTYGVVRNCWYQFTLMGINRIGTPVDDPGESIVPELINIKDVINSKTDMHVVPWHKEETIADIY